MIQIIKPPTKTYQDIKVRKHFRCRHCGTEWVCDDADYTVKSAEVWVKDSQYSNHYVEQYNCHVICPICGWENLFEYFDKGKTWEDIPYNQTNVETFY